MQWFTTPLQLESHKKPNIKRGLRQTYIRPKKKLLLVSAQNM